MSYRFADSLRAGAYAPARCVYSEKTPDDRQRNCPKHVDFYCKNKFGKLVHLVGFIVRNLVQCTVTWTSNSSLNAPRPYIKNWPQVGLLETKHVASYILMIIYIVFE
jgi:hypothetical protein